jgi:hypothetical protein
MFPNLKDKVDTTDFAIPRFQKDFILNTDASNQGLGAVLSQGEIGKDLPIAYASRNLNKAEKTTSRVKRNF